MQLRQLLSDEHRRQAAELGLAWPVPAAQNHRLPKESQDPGPGPARLGTPTWGDRARYEEPWLQPTSEGQAEWGTSGECYKPRTVVSLRLRQVSG